MTRASEGRHPACPNREWSTDAPRSVRWPPSWLLEYANGFPAVTAGDDSGEQARTALGDQRHYDGELAKEQNADGEADHGATKQPAVAQSTAGVLDFPVEGRQVPLPRTLGAVAQRLIPIDLETQSRCPLTEEGGRRYARHPSTRLLSVVALVNGRGIVWTPCLAEPLPVQGLWPDGYERCGLPRLSLDTYAGPELPAILREAIAGGGILLAHNAWNFDEHVWRAQGLPEPTLWLDTLPLARAAGLPGGLDALGQRLAGVGKDAGKQLLRRLCRPDAEGRLPEPSAEEAAALVRYNLADLLLLFRVLAEVVQVPLEAELLAADRGINERGIAFDPHLAQILIDVEAELGRAAVREVERLTSGAVQEADLDRTDYLLKWLHRQGAALPNLQRPTLETFLAGDGISPAVRAVLQARLAHARITGDKLQSALDALEDGRLRDLLVYHGAHTGRWTARGVQPHNLPKPGKGFQELPALLAAAADPPRLRKLLAACVDPGAALSALVRPCFRAAPGKVLLIADYAGIEARGVAWLGGEERLLEQFAADTDVYCTLASVIFGRPIARADEAERGVGKLGVLGCGYGMSGAKFAEYAATAGVDLSAVGLTAGAVVESYRAAYPRIAGQQVRRDGRTWRDGGLWRDLEEAARIVLQLAGGEVCRVARCRVWRAARALVVQLPSGRHLVYRNARVEDVVPGYCARLGLPERPKPTVVYDGPEELDVPTYGGKLTENIVQAVCRDLLAEALVACEREALPVVLHVHDEIVVEVPSEEAEVSLRRLVVLMSQPPAWAAGFPIKVEGFAAERYVKSAPRGAPVAVARDGKINT